MNNYVFLADIDEFFIQDARSILPLLQVEVDQRKIQRQMQNNLKKKKNVWDPDEVNSKIEN